jgi:peptidoglycan/LPS O-acetylase OafA/YrhL
MTIQNAPHPSLVLSCAPVATEDQSRAVSKRRNEAIDVIRLIAAAGIVYIHSVRSPVLEGSRNLFRFAVPFYLFASFYFQSNSLRKKTDRTFLHYVWGRVKRLYFPFLAWSLIYLVARDIKRIFSLHTGPVKLVPGLLWKGIEYHLWFLPFLLASSVLLAAIFWTTLKFDRRWRWPLIAAAIAAGFAFAYVPMPASWDQTFDNPTYAYVQDWRAMPAMCWGLAFAWFMTMGPKVYSVDFATGFAGIALCIYCSVRQALHGIELVPRALSGLGAMLTSLAPWSGKWIPFLAKYGRYSYGIYLCHVLIAEFVRAGASHLHRPNSLALDMLNFFFTLMGSIFLVLVLGRSPRTAWLNG